MRRYYFDHCENGRFYPDARGHDCADEADAEAVAALQVRRRVRDRLRDGSMPLGGYVTVRLGCGERLMFLPYRNAMAG
jgi:hypothetical protein